MRKVFLIFSLFYLPFISFGQTKADSIEIYLSGRVDTTNSEINAIYHLFKDYLQSKPDSIRVNPYWNKKEQEGSMAGNIALFYTPFYNLGAGPATIFNIWKPYILSIESKTEEKYLLRIALIKNENSPDKVLTILNLNAILENGKWVLQNTLIDYLNEWNQKQHKYIRYVYPKTYDFNDQLAESSIRYCDSICALLNLKQVDTFTYYICNNPDEMGLLFGYEFYYLNYTTGLTIKWRKEIYSAKDSEFYPHEFMHMLFNSINNDSIDYIIEEGLASFLGELNSTKYINQIRQLAKDYVANKPTYTLDNLLDNSAEWNGYQTAYPTGSIIAELTFERAGYIGLRKLIESNTLGKDNIYKVLKQITKLSKSQLEKEFRKKLNTYLKDKK